MEKSNLENEAAMWYGNQKTTTQGGLLMKKLILSVTLILVLTVSAAWASSRHSTSNFHQQDTLLTPEIAAVNHSVSFGGNFEYGFSRNLGLGGDVLFWVKGSGGLIISPDISYHFDVNNRDLDLFIGAGPNLAIPFASGADTDFGVKIFLGSRFYFTPKMAAYFKVFAALSSDSSMGMAFGVTFR
jgi:hypothetical protein